MPNRHLPIGLGTPMRRRDDHMPRGPEAPWFPALPDHDNQDLFDRREVQRANPGRRKTDNPGTAGATGGRVSE